jgi:protein TonB
MPFDPEGLSPPPPAEAPPIAPTALALAEAAPPRPRPDPAQQAETRREPQREAQARAGSPTRPQPEKQAQPLTEPPSQARRRAAADGPARETAAAPETSRGGGARAMASWQARLVAHLERRKRYPAAALARRAEGVAQVRFAIDRSGRVLSSRLAASSGDPALDAEAVAMVLRASPVPAPPPDAPLELVAPVKFSRR